MIIMFVSMLHLFCSGFCNRSNHRIIPFNRHVPNMGRVEVQNENGIWGLICDDEWDDLDAVVFCDCLGYQRSVYWNTYGPNTIWIIQLKCQTCKLAWIKSPSHYNTMQGFKTITPLLLSLWSLLVHCPSSTISLSLWSLLVPCPSSAISLLPWSIPVRC